MAFNLSMNASDIDKTLVDSRRLLDSEPATKQYVDEKATWENLQGKPTIFEGGDTLTWDGDTTGLEYVEVDVGDGPIPFFFKVSDAVITRDDLANGIQFTSSTMGSSTLPAEVLQDSFDTYGCFAMEAMYAPPINNFTLNLDGINVLFPTAGVWMFNPDAVGYYLTSLTIPGYTGFGKEVIDPDYLSESVKGGSGGVVYVTFTTTDGNIYTSDKTFAEVEALVAKSKVVLGIMVLPEGEKNYIPLSMYVPGAMMSFTSTAFVGTALTFNAILFISDGTIQPATGIVTAS